MESNARITRDPLPAVWIDATLTTQLYQNLIGNAIKFARNGIPPEIHLTAEEERGKTILGVRDNGIGIQPKYATQIFSPFKRLHGQAEYDGCGIGLAICRKAVDRHCGQIWVDTEAETGSHFKFFLELPGSESESAVAA